MMDIRTSALLLFECVGRGVGRPRPTAALQAEGRQAETRDGTQSTCSEWADTTKFVNCFTMSALPAADFVAGMTQLWPR